MNILVSACLLGENCKYNGGNNYCPEVVKLVEGHRVIPVCPEREAGLGCPRVPMEIVNGVLINKDGVVVDGAVRGAVESILQRAAEEGVDRAILKSRSPTCGVRQVYDGTFSGTLIDGAGVLTQALQAAGIPVTDSEEV